MAAAMRVALTLSGRTLLSIGLACLGAILATGSPSYARTEPPVLEVGINEKLGSRVPQQLKIKRDLIAARLTHAPAA